MSLNADNYDEEAINSSIEEKLKSNLQWCLIFFMFNYICADIDSSSEKKGFYKKFFNKWKKFITENVIKNDLEAINSILNSPKNSFYFILKNSNEETESTELYQEKYNAILKEIESFYFNSIKNSEIGDG